MVEEYVDSQVAPDVIALFQQKVLGPMLHKKEPDAAVVRRLLLEDLPPKLDYLEASLQGEYLVGGRASVADITLASDLAIFHYIGCTLDPARHPNLLTHFKRMLRRDSFRTALVAAAVCREDGARPQLAAASGVVAGTGGAAQRARAATPVRASHRAVVRRRARSDSRTK